MPASVLFGYCCATVTTNAELGTNSSLLLVGLCYKHLQSELSGTLARRPLSWCYLPAFFSSFPPPPAPPPAAAAAALFASASACLRLIASASDSFFLRMSPCDCFSVLEFLACRAWARARSVSR